MSLLGAIELEMREACRLALNYLTRQRVERREYLHLMEALRDAVRRADLKELGCPSGTHTSDCTCDPGRAGRSVHALKYRGRQKGYTLIELMIVVAIMGILSAICMPMAGDAIARAKQATTLGNLAVLRMALATYAVDHDGQFPQFAAGEVGANYSPVLQLALVPTYLRAIPDALSPRGQHRTSSDVAAYWNQQGQDDNEVNGMGRGWKYDANHASSTWGSIYVLCNHPDLKGQPWTTH